MSLWTDTMAAETAMREATKLIEEQRAAIDELVAALQAVLYMWDCGPQPRKLDDALTWRQNDERAREMGRAAVAKHAPAQSQEDA